MSKKKKNKILVYGCIVILLAIVIIFTLVGGAFAVGFMALNPLGGGAGTGGGGGTIGTGGGDLANADALTPEQIQDILTNKISYGYNLKDHSQQIYDSGKKFNINPLFLLAIANKDSSLGTAGAGETCRNPGNLEYRDHKFADSGISAIGNCDDAYGGSSRWAAFKTYGDGIQAKSWLLRVNYLDKGLTTLPEIIGKYCPASECDVNGYVKDVENFMEKYNPN